MLVKEKLRCTCLVHTLHNPTGSEFLEFPSWGFPLVSPIVLSKRSYPLASASPAKGFKGRRSRLRKGRIRPNTMNIHRDSYQSFRRVGLCSSIYKIYTVYKNRRFVIKKPVFSFNVSSYNIPINHSSTTGYLNGNDVSPMIVRIVLRYMDWWCNIDFLLSVTIMFNFDFLFIFLPFFFDILSFTGAIYVIYTERWTALCRVLVWFYELVRELL